MDFQSFYDSFQNTMADYFKQGECKTQGGVCYPKSDWAHTPSDKPSDWKLLLSQGRPGNITVSQLGRAAAAFSPGGFRGNKVQLSSSDATKAKSRIRREYRKLGVKAEDMPDSVKALEKAFHVWKDKFTGQYKWLATYSNNIRDDDNPPEIIASKSHERFVELVDKGQADLPELWLWHVPQWKWGQSTAIAYDGNGFAVATGDVDKGCEPIAEWYKERDDQLVSHGMPKRTVKRDPEDSSIIIEHITREISPLFDWAAANKHTGFNVLMKELDMDEQKGIPEHKREEFIKAGLPAEVLDMLEEKNSAKAKETSDLEKKEEAAKEEETPTQDDTSFSDIAEAIKSITRVVAELQAEVKELKKSDSQKIAEKAAGIPEASLAELVNQTLFNKANEVQNKGNGPAETPADEQREQPFFAGWISPQGEVVR